MAALREPAVMKPLTLGTATAEMMPMRAVEMRSSIRVNPWELANLLSSFFIIFFLLHLVGFFLTLPA